MDIVGSTDFKQSKSSEAEQSHSWVPPFLLFYKRSVEQMAAQWKGIVAEMKAVEPKNGSGRFRFGEAPSFWKGAGDEVLFTKVVVSPFDAVASLHAMLAVMEQHRRDFADKALADRLAVKGCAWLGGFPINNVEIALSDTPDPISADIVLENQRELWRREHQRRRRGAGSERSDYIGPSIDLGFRLREHATTRRLVMSADLAWLLCVSHNSCKPNDFRRSRYLALPRVAYADRVELRGILGGERYPLLWIEAEPDAERDADEDYLLGVTQPDAAFVDRLKRFCENFLSGGSPLKMRPYIAGWRDPVIGRVPARHREDLRIIEAQLNGDAAQLADLRRRDAAATAKRRMPKRLEDFAKGLTRRP
ncbi:MAG: hypothetical protein U1E60_00560 [Reyranellaceae bacterium]